VRAIVIVTAIVIVVAGTMLRYLPNLTVNAEVAVNRPIARLQEVRSISLDGQKLPLAQLRAVLETRAGQQLDTPRLERDRDAMEAQLASLGYLAARVEPAIVTFDTAGAAYVSFEIDQGELFHLRNIAVTGTAKDAVVVTLTAGDTALRDRIERARNAMSDGLARRGIPPAVELSVHTDLATAAVDVVFTTRE
jgi:outer membrane protein assembly factor BamA